MSDCYLEFEDYDGNKHKIPAVFGVCDRCRGTGVHDHPAFSNGISQEQFDEDPEFKEDYMAGKYDVRCSECKGQRVVPVVNPDTLSAPDKELYELYLQMQRDEAQSRAEVEAERRMGA
jgi:hypothetical protein